MTLRALPLDTTVPDLQEAEVQVGDTIAAAFREGDQPALRVGKVLGFHEQTGIYGGPKTLIEVDWIAARRSWHLTQKPSKIDASLKRFVLIPQPEDTRRRLKAAIDQIVAEDRPLLARLSVDD